MSIAQGIDLAGDLSITAGTGGITVAGGIDGAHDLVLDAAGAAISVTGAIGSTTRLTGLGVAGTSATLVTVNADELAVTLTGANQRVVVTNNGALRIGTVSSITGISTNTGDVVLTTSGLLEIAAAISTAGAAAPGNIGQGQQTGGVALTGGVGGISLGADIRTNGGMVALNNATTITAASVTIDTDQAAGGDPGGVFFSGSGTSRSQRRINASGVIPMLRSAATECCVGLVLSSPDGAM